MKHLLDRTVFWNEKAPLAHKIVAGAIGLGIGILLGVVL